MDKELHWKFDISTFRLLGRELITDRITALVELVKNSYDANSKNVYIEFIDTSDSNIGKIIIRDDGFGMSSNDIESKWMTIGTNSKRVNKYTEDPFKRRVVGEKGIGRFAIDKLGADCKIYAKKRNENQLNLLIIDWDMYENNPNSNITEFNNVSNKLKTRSFISECSGVKIIIKNIHDLWANSDIDRVYKEMAKIVSPFNKLYPPFNIYITSNEHKNYKIKKLVVNNSIKYSTEKIEISYQNETQEVVRFSKKFGSLDIIHEEIKSFGPVKFNLYYFDKYAKGNFSKNYKGAELQIDGIRIYRDGILTTPFAEDNSMRDHQRDILGIDKRRWSGFFDRIASRDLIGVLEITKDLCPNIIDATNRQDFISNKEYTDLKSFIVEQIIELEKFLKYKKQVKYHEYDRNLEDAKHNLNDFSKELNELKTDVSNKEKFDFDERINELEISARKANIALKQGLRQQKEERLESKRKESMYMSLMSLQTYALEITHIIKTSLGHIKRRAEFNKKYSEKGKHKEVILKYNSDIMIEIDKLSSAIDFMSTYTRSEKNWENFDVKNLINSIFVSYQPIFEKNKIKNIIEIENNILLYYNSILFGDIIKNLINNSIKFTTNRNDKMIKISAYMEYDHLILIFSDNGEGIPSCNINKIYEIYFTTTSEYGGNGMGLYMVKTNLDAINGSIEVIDSEIGDGATFRLKFPFKSK